MCIVRVCALFSVKIPRKKLIQAAAWIFIETVP
jgi:hypothetical protein